MTYPAALQAHLESGTTTIARAWAVTRADGTVLGFTDHDRPLSFGGIEFEPDSGMTAKTIAQGTGLSVDNSEAYGALRSEAITEADLLAGRYDAAEVRIWIVNWAKPTVRAMIFRGAFGEVTRGGGAFTVELRGLSEPLSAEKGRVYHPRCGACLGDTRCGFDVSQPGYATEIALESIEDARIFRFASVPGFEDRWFEKGRFEVLSGAAAGLVGVIKNDRVEGSGRRMVELWTRLGQDVAAGDRVRMIAGCDRRATTCRLKFDNFLNFRGFPHIPGEDWLTSYPVSSDANTGGSLFE